MDAAFTELLRTINILGSKDRTKEEQLAYLDFLRYARSLSRLNEDAVVTEINRRIGEELHAGEYPTTSP